MSILNNFKLDGKVALVTGSRRGLGRAMAIGLAEAGADIVGLSSTSDQPDTQTAITTMGRKFMPISLDLLQASNADLCATINHVVDKFGRLDILVNNAGIARRAPIMEYTENDWSDVLQVNLNAVFLLSQAAVKVMQAQGSGKIINIASLLSFQGGYLVPSYAASKHAVAGLTKSMANELAPHNINVNAIAPGYMATDLTGPLQADENRNRAILERIPAGRWGDANDLQGCVVFLASDASRYVHGEIITVDGGWMAR